MFLCFPCSLKACSLGLVLPMSIIIMDFMYWYGIYFEVDGKPVLVLWIAGIHMIAILAIDSGISAEIL